MALLQVYFIGHKNAQFTCFYCVSKCSSLKSVLKCKLKCLSTTKKKKNKSEISIRAITISYLNGTCKGYWEVQLRYSNTIIQSYSTCHKKSLGALQLSTIQNTFKSNFSQQLYFEIAFWKMVRQSFLNKKFLLQNGNIH